jgi:hypothetical protein
VDKTSSNRNEIWLRSNDVRSQPLDKEVEEHKEVKVDIRKLIETLDCE